ncbi:uncharacterized protein At4g04775-like [Lotus japonicus]|uniref:uncharacterized protein At4g04775-like n=1 Tax=Lotus japonicus TaxID=34305 RepID=UPI0025877CF7|nr:uncharacterized protein At4g04775-like [Lotus japonicus]
MTQNQKAWSGHGGSTTRMNNQMCESTQNTRFCARSSSFCTPCPEKSCGCGKQVIMYKSNSKLNPGKLFWRCPDWKESRTCGFFEWVKAEGEAENEADNEESSKVNVELKIVEDLTEMMDNKIGKLREELQGDMKEIMQSVIGKIMEDENEMKDKKIAKLKLKLKNEGLKSNVLLVLLVLGCAVVLAKYF